MKCHPVVINVVLAVALISLPSLVASPAQAAEVGDEVKNVDIRDAEDEPAKLPSFGQKVISIIYADTDAADANDPLADAIKAKKFDESKFLGMGIANLEDSAAPNFIIRKVVRGKIEKYKSTILTDPSLILPKSWKLGNVNNTSVYILIGKDKKIKYLKRGEIRGAEIDTILQLITTLINEP